MTGWWWPGILLALGLAAGARLAFEGQYRRALIAFGIFAAIPVLIPLMGGVAAAIPWRTVAILTLASLGVVAIVKAFVLKEDS